MKNTIKKMAFLLSAVVLSCLFTFQTFSAEVKTGDDFYVYNKQTEKVCEVLGVEENAIDNYCEQNNVEFFAVDKENKRQIKLLCFETDFSNSIVNVTSMSNDNISSLMPELVGMDNVKGDIVTKNGQKFIITSVMTSDSGGEYILTSYTTVANRKNYVLSFYTLKGEDTDYIEKIFGDYAKSKDFMGEEEKNYSLQRAFIFIGVVFFIAAFVMVGITVIKDLKSKASDSDLEIEEKEKTEETTQETEELENAEENKETE